MYLQLSNNNDTIVIRDIENTGSQTYMTCAILCTDDSGRLFPGDSRR